MRVGNKRKNSKPKSKKRIRTMRSWPPLISKAWSNRPYRCNNLEKAINSAMEKFPYDKIDLNKLLIKLKKGEQLYTTYSAYC